MLFRTLVYIFFNVIILALADTFVEEFRMPGVRTEKDDEYLCTWRKVDDEPEYITSFKPIHDEEVTHHMIIFGCNQPGSREKVWKCSRMTPVCRDVPKVIFSWAMNAPSFTLPQDTSFPLDQSVHQYLVLQVHYKDKKSFDNDPSKKDTSGWNLTVQTEPTKKLAGVYLFIADGMVKPYGETTVGVSCQYTGEATLHPFAFRVHAHSHGQMNDAYVLQDGKKLLIGAKSPQEKQTYYPVQNKNLEIYPGDYLYARCNMTNNEGKAIYMGSTRKDEMCNFYMMYSVDYEDAAQLVDPKNQECMSEFSDPMYEIKSALENLLDTAPEFYEDDIDY